MTVRENQSHTNRMIDNKTVSELPLNFSVVSVYLSNQNIIETVPLEDYVKSVLVAEMPVTFELEALKAQAIASRTYIVERKIFKRKVETQTNADVVDTTLHQAYKNQKEIKKIGEIINKQDFNKIEQAVRETNGMIILHDNVPIQALYFSTSNGYTENSEDYWNNYFPYLRSVESPWDKKISPKFISSKLIHYRELQRKLSISKLADDLLEPIKIKVIERSKSNRVIKVKVADKIVSGKQFREQLGLHSTDFEFYWENQNLKITSYGFGHGVGLSQYGAQGMAQEGKNVEEILRHYYPGTTIGHIKFLNKTLYYN